MISKEDIVSLAGLARISVSDTEAQDLQKDISSILAYVGQIAEVSAEGQPNAAVRNAMREDIPYRKDHPLFGKQKAILDEAPLQEDSYLIVRKILDKDA